MPVAAGALIPFGITLSPMLGAAAMSLSSFCVVTNTLRLNLFGKEEHIKVQKEIKKMKKTFRIEGMMCTHCSGRVKKVLEAIDGVSAADVSHESGLAVVTLDKEVADTVIIASIENEGYTVIK